MFAKRELAQLIQQNSVAAAEDDQALSNEGLKTFNSCLFICLAVDRMAIERDSRMQI